MKFCIKIALVCIVLLLIIPFITLGQSQQNQQSIAKEFLELIELDSFEEAASLFHYPNTYTIEKKKSEFKSVKDALEKFKKHLGSVIQIVNYMPDGKFIGTGVSGADIDYWVKNQKQSHQIVLPYKFEKINLGVIRILFCNIDSKWEIQSVDYSFIKSDESIKLLKKLQN